MFRFLKICGNLVIILLTAWSIVVSIAYFFDISVYFPWREAIAGEIPVHRLEAIRIAVILTFAYFGILHIFGKNVRLYPINFLTIFLFYLVTSGTYVFYKFDVPKHEYWVSLIWGIIWIMTYTTTRPSIRNYFKRRR
jgi:hypothetical protein